MFCKKGVLINFAKFTGKHLCQNPFFNKAADLRAQGCIFIKKETLAQVFSCEFCEISKNTFFHRTSLVAASEYIFELDKKVTSKDFELMFLACPEYAT